MKFLTFDESRDFPYYNHNPRISKKAWLILLILVPVSLIVYSLIGEDNEFLGSVVFCLILLIPLLYFSNWDYKLLFRKPSKSELILAFLMFVIYMVYASVMDGILAMFNLTVIDASLPYEINAISVISLVFSMMGEELLKFIPLMFFMRLIFKYTNKRNLSFGISVVIVLAMFGLLHYDPSMSTLASVFLLQGLGSLVEIYGYYKTKNLLVPYLSHLFTDAFAFIMIMIGVMA